jgi:hypothetical protein
LIRHSPHPFKIKSFKNDILRFMNITSTYKDSSKQIYLTTVITP